VDFKNKVAIVTGGGSGLGGATAIKLAEGGAKSPCSQCRWPMNASSPDVAQHHADTFSLMANLTKRWLLKPDIMPCHSKHRSISFIPRIGDRRRQRKGEGHSLISCWHFSLVRAARDRNPRPRRARL
jgi:hypothetical protein